MILLQQLFLYFNQPFAITDSVRTIQDFRVSFHSPWKTYSTNEKMPDEVRIVYDFSVYDFGEV